MLAVREGGKRRRLCWGEGKERGGREGEEAGCCFFYKASFYPFLFLHHFGAVCTCHKALSRGEGGGRGGEGKGEHE